MEKQQIDPSRDTWLPRYRFLEFLTGEKVKDSSLLKKLNTLTAPKFFMVSSFLMMEAKGVKGEGSTCCPNDY